MFINRTFNQSEVSLTYSLDADSSIKNKLRILVMDDELHIRVILARLLKRAGYEVVTTADGTQALAEYQQAQVIAQPFAAVILDLDIAGGMGGSETIKKLLEVDKQVKAIISTGNHSDPLLANYRSHGFKGLVTKPYLIEEMLAVLQQILTG